MYGSVRVPAKPFLPPPNKDGVRNLNPEDPGSLYYTHIIQGNFAQTRISNWRDLLDCAVRTASQKGVPFSSIEEITAARDQDPGERNFHQVDRLPRCGSCFDQIQRAFKDSWNGPSDL